MKKMIIAGGSGFLGQNLASHFKEQFDEIVILSRKISCSKENVNVRFVQWDGVSQGEWSKELEGAAVLINLAGKSVNCRYNRENQRKILYSRLNATGALTIAISNLVQKPKVWLNAASATIYRHAEDKDMTEATGEYGEGFSVNVCTAWENAFLSASIPSIRKIALRIGIVLGKDDGVFIRFKNLVKFGLGGKQGKGTQFFSWIHVEDFCRSVEWLIDHEDQVGIFNITAPAPVTNRFLMHQFRRAMNCSIGLPSPEWMLKIGAVLIGTETELILKSRRVVPERLVESGFEFSYPTIPVALRNLI
ncbi:TIGR01777 family oxidoreductase [Solitalea canadensis]|uniref:TIGR01777 family protein n=1 Tax=Solitalea canadensis (strain ATCC 29591 / DSM 3403 / JCM 21819 / LMG 8368 / NBRC 15130 / NCIMB 12057 / USAM 9D) TaxID=929556 RepID=H8KWD0_SOLCM|nr:TIGR01777 family oxidoreductase [Solitalea canadensis]AFD07922.1 TIGR01777 family protein [Solitalea canadensis DSM 3403]